MKRTTIDAGMRVGARALLATVATMALSRAGSRFRRTLMLVAVAAIADALRKSDALDGRRGRLGALLTRR